MTLADLRTALRTRIGNPTTADVPDATLDEHLNIAYRRICDRHRLPQLIERATFNTVAGTRSYNIPSNTLYLKQVWDKTNRLKLRKLDYSLVDEFDDSSSSNITTGRPKEYYRAASTIMLYPLPDAVYVIETISKIKPTALALVGDTPVLSEPWHDGIVLLARWSYWDTILDFPKATQAFTTYQSWLQDKTNEMDQESVDLDEGVEIVGLSTRDRRQLSFDDSW